MKHSRFVNLAEAIKKKLPQSSGDDAEDFACSLWKVLTHLYQIETGHIHETKEIVRLRSIGISWEEISRILDISIETARKQYFIFEELSGEAQLVALCDYSPAQSIFHDTDCDANTFNINKSIASFGKLPKQQYTTTKPKDIQPLTTPMFGLIVSKN